MYNVQNMLQNISLAKAVTYFAEAIYIRKILGEGIKISCLHLKLL